MAYHQQVKGDDAFNMKFYYLCQTRGCGAVINPEYPVAEKNPSPKWCKDCQSKVVRDEIVEQFDVLQKTN